MFQASKQRAAKKMIALATFPFVAALGLSACSDDTNASEDVNITPIANEPSQLDTSTDFGQSDDVSSNEMTETSFARTQNGMESTMTYTARGDRVTKQTATNVIDYAAAGFSDKDAAREVLDPLVAESQDVTGYQQTVEYGETSAVEELMIDYEVADMSEVSQLPGYEVSADMGQHDYISLQESRRMLESSGFTEVE